MLNRAISGFFLNFAALWFFWTQVAAAQPEVVAEDGLLRVGSASPQIALVFFPGALLPSEKYVDIASKIVERSGDTLTVFLANRFANVTNPIEARVRIQTVVNQMERQFGDEARARVFVAGHSEGAIASINLPVSMDLGGMILLAAYVPRTIGIGQSLADYRKPVLTLGGELDGLTGINYLAREAQTVQVVAETDAVEAGNKPVIILPGVNHMQFADGSPLSGDMVAEVDTPTAHAEIADRMVSFIEMQTPVYVSSKERAKRQLRQDVVATLGMIKAYTLTNDVETSWCELAQKRVAGLPPEAFAAIDFDTKAYYGLLGKGQFVLDKAKLTADGDRFKLHLPVFVNQRPGPLDVSKDHALSPDSMWCKMRTAEALSADTQLPSSSDTVASCAELNRWVIEQSLALLAPQARARIEDVYGQIAAWSTVTSFESGRERVEYGPFVINSVSASTGQGWVLGHFGFSGTRVGWQLDTVELKTGLDTWLPQFSGANYCKLVTPGRVVEWATLFGLKN